MNVLDRIPQELRAGALDRIHQLGRAKILKPFRTRLLTQAGVAMDVWVAATALVNEAGHVYAIATTERAFAKEAPVLKNTTPPSCASGPRKKLRSRLKTASP